MRANLLAAYPSPGRSGTGTAHGEPGTASGDVPLDSAAKVGPRRHENARISGVPFTSERQLTGTGPAEASATIVHRVLAELGLDEQTLLWNLDEQTLLWNVVPTHPGTRTSNRRPTTAEVDAAAPFLAELSRGRRVVAVGRLAEAVTGAAYVRHPSHGGATAFRAGLALCCYNPPPADAFVRRFSA